MIAKLKEERAVATRCLKNLKRLDFGKSEASEKSMRKSTFASNMGDKDYRFTSRGDLTLISDVKRTTSGNEWFTEGALIKTRLSSDLDRKSGRVLDSLGTQREAYSSTRCGTDRPKTDRNIFARPKQTMGVTVRRKAAKYRFESASNDLYFKSLNYQVK